MAPSASAGRSPQLPGRAPPPQRAVGKNRMDVWRFVRSRLGHGQPGVAGDRLAHQRCERLAKRSLDRHADRSIVDEAGYLLDVWLQLGPEPRHIVKRDRWRIGAANHHRQGSGLARHELDQPRPVALVVGAGGRGPDPDSRRHRLHTDGGAGRPHVADLGGVPRRPREPKHPPTAVVVEAQTRPTPCRVPNGRTVDPRRPASTLRPERPPARCQAGRTAIGGQRDHLAPRPASDDDNDNAPLASRRQHGRDRAPHPGRAYLGGEVDHYQVVACSGSAGRLSARSRRRRSLRACLCTTKALPRGRPERSPTDMLLGSRFRRASTTATPPPRQAHHDKAARRLNVGPSDNNESTSTGIPTAGRPPNPSACIVASSDTGYFRA